LKDKKCICKSGYVPILPGFQFFSCHKLLVQNNTKIDINCDYDEDCQYRDFEDFNSRDNFQSCVNNKCKCTENFRWDATERRCNLCFTVKYKCKSDLDCNDCKTVKYCADGFCSRNCLNVEVGHNCTSDVDCNPDCALWSGRKYCVDKKCSLADKSNPKQTSDHTLFYWFVGILLGALSLFLYGILKFQKIFFRKNHTNPC
jgi:hypothetical protein